MGFQIPNSMPAMLVTHQACTRAETKIDLRNTTLDNMLLRGTILCRQYNLGKIHRKADRTQQLVAYLASIEALWKKDFLDQMSVSLFVSLFIR